MVKTLSTWMVLETETRRFEIMLSLGVMLGVFFKFYMGIIRMISNVNFNVEMCFIY